MAETDKTPPPQRQRVALVISPFATSPADAGQRKRALQTTRMLKRAGYYVVFVLVAFEGSWRWRWNPETVSAMQGQWDEVHVYPGNSCIGTLPENPPYHALDEWWDESFGDWLNLLLSIRQIDVALVHNVWLSMALTLFPPGTVKILDTHDVFHCRAALSPLSAEFFQPSAMDEFYGLNRADVVLAIQESETELLMNALDTSVRFLPYDLEEEELQALPRTAKRKKPGYLCPDRVRFGFIGNNSNFNTMGLKALVRALRTKLAFEPAPIELVLAGQVCDALPEEDFHAIRLGYVPDEETFFDACDVMIAPIFTGTGMKVKSIDALARSKPALFSEHAAEGIPIPSQFICDTPAAMVAEMCDIAYRRPSLPAMAQRIAAAYGTHRSRTQSRSDALLQVIERRSITLEIDLSQVTDPDILMIAGIQALGTARSYHGIVLMDIVAPALLGMGIETVVSPNCRIIAAPREESGLQRRNRMVMAPDGEWTDEGTAGFNLRGLTNSITWEPSIQKLTKGMSAHINVQTGGIFRLVGNLRAELRLQSEDASGLVLVAKSNMPPRRITAVEAITSALDGEIESVFRLADRPHSQMEENLFSFLGLFGVRMLDETFGEVPQERLMWNAGENERLNQLAIRKLVGL